MDDDAAATRDLVVIGTSAGGVGALSELCGQLSAEIPAAIVVVMHLATSARSHLAQILRRATKLRVRSAASGQELEHGTIFVAPPDHHTVIRDGVVGLNHGPRENRHRPSIDALFRTAASARGARVVGVILTGALDDGAAGLHCIQRAGGVAVVQDPADAEFPSMPESALRIAPTENVVPLAEIAALLDRLVREPIAASGGPAPLPSKELSRNASGFVCPDCGGSLAEVVEEDLIRYECRIGHRYSPITLDAASDEATEAALWSALRALRESAAVDRRLLELARGGRPTTGVDYAAYAEDKERQADRIEALLLDALGVRGAKA